jgi:hypothetical protein
MFNKILSIGAFGLVVFVLVFMHPAPHAGPAAAQHADAPGGSAPAPAAPASARLAASK